ncbi:MAG TPA: S8 family serine peptidase, partial [Candidatus Limnocylindrales bacterium]
MRRHVAALVAAALLLSIAGPAAAADPPSPSADPSLAPIVDPTPSPEPTPAVTPAASVRPAATADPAVDGEPGPTDPPAPATDPSPASSEPAAPGETTDTADPTNRWIVIYKPGTDAKATAGRQSGRLGFTADRTFTNVTRGFTARLTKHQIGELRRDPSVAAVVPDERIELAAQTPPTGIGRIYVRRSAAAQLDGIDQRVDADVAIVDTGIARVADLNVAGGYNCSTTDRTLWRDVHGHGTHVAGTVGAIDNTVGVVGVAPGVRVWAVKILNDNGSGLLSWYVCGLDWIAAQRDPAN